MAIYGHNFDVFVGKNHNASNKKVADLTAASGDTSEFAVELEATGLLAETTALAAGDIFRIVQLNTDGTLHASPFIKFDNCRRGSLIEHGDATNSDYIAEAEQVSNVGYTSVNTSSSIDAVNSNRYTVRLNFINDTELYSEQKDQYFFEYVSDASASQQEISDYFAANMGMMKYLADGSSTGPHRARVKVERFNSASGSDVNSELDAVTVTRGSDIVACTAISSTSVNAGLVAGVYLRFDVSGTGGGSGGADAPTVDPIYKVLEVDTDKNFIKLDQPYQGTNLAIEDDDIHFLTKAEVDAGSAGFRITGLDQFHKVGLYPYHKIVFNLTLDGFGSTVSDTSTKAAKGNSVAESIADLEWFSLSKNSPGGASFTGTGFPSAQTYAELKADTANSQVYDVISIDYVLEGGDSNAISAGGPIRGTIVMALPGDADSEQDHLNAIFAGVPGCAGTILAAS